MFSIPRGASGAVALGLVGTALLFQPLVSAVTPQDWPQWRGPGGLGVSAERSLPVHWSATSNVVWRTPILGQGHSSPVVVGNRIFLTSAVEGEPIDGAKAVPHRLGGSDFKHPESVGADRRQSLHVLALDRATGGILWNRVAYAGRVHDDRHRKGSYAAPTPAADDAHVYAFFGGEGLYCYTHDGTPVWKVALGGLATLGLGASASPILWDGLVLVQCDQDNGEGSFLAAYDARTGVQRWKVARKVSVSWATPVLVRHQGRGLLFTSGNERVIAYDASTGREVWSMEGLLSNAVPSPVASSDQVFFSSGYPSKRTVAVRVGGLEAAPGTNAVAWRYDKGTGYVPSAICYGDHLYLVTDSGMLTCLEHATGRVVYEGARLPKAVRMTASPVAHGGWLFLTSELGETFVVRAGAKHEVVATNAVNEGVFASLALGRGELFIRGETHLFCVRETQAGSGGSRGVPARSAKGVLDVPMPGLPRGRGELGLVLTAPEVPVGGTPVDSGAVVGGG